MWKTKAQATDVTTRVVRPHTLGHGLLIAMMTATPRRMMIANRHRSGGSGEVAKRITVTTIQTPASVQAMRPGPPSASSPRLEEGSRRGGPGWSSGVLKARGCYRAAPVHAAAGSGPIEAKEPDAPAGRGAGLFGFVKARFYVATDHLFAGDRA